MLANLAGRRVVAYFCVDAERRKTLGSPQFNLDLAPTGVAGPIARVVAHEIPRDLSSRIRWCARPLRRFRRDGDQPKT